MNLANYLSDQIDCLFRQALSNCLRNPRETTFLLRQVRFQKQAAETRRCRAAVKKPTPAFLIASVASACNLHCTGCYARAEGACDADSAQLLSAARWGELFHQAVSLGISFILLAGGEPLTRMDVLETAAQVPEIVFPVLTNGTLFDETTLRLFDRHRHLVPICSIEGGADETDMRRGSGVYHRLEQTWQRMRARGLLFGVSITVTAENHLHVTDPAFLKNLHEHGCDIVFYVEYVPADAHAPLHTPDAVQRAVFSDRLECLRSQFSDLILIAFPGDEAETGGCLAAGRGFFHINSTGGAEPCPFAPVSAICLRTGSLEDALQSPLFERVRQSDLLALPHAGGCALFGKDLQPESPDFSR